MSERTANTIVPRPRIRLTLEYLLEFSPLVDREEDVDKSGVALPNLAARCNRHRAAEEGVARRGSLWRFTVSPKDADASMGTLSCSLDCGRI